MMTTDLGEQFRAAMRRFPSTVSVISTAKDGQRHGMTATAVTSVSLDPPSLLVCVNRSGRLFGMMESCHRFCVNVLHAEHVAVSRNFAEPNCPDRFAYGEWHEDEHGIPYLLDAQVAMSCVKSLSVPHGSHTVFFGNVEEIKIREDISTLLYQNGGYGVFQPLSREADASLAQLVGWG